MAITVNQLLAKRKVTSLSNKTTWFELMNSLRHVGFRCVKSQDFWCKICTPHLPRGTIWREGKNACARKIIGVKEKME